jgi:hypothetical protein
METPRRVRGSRSLLGRLRGTPGASPTSFGRESVGSGDTPRSPRVERDRTAAPHRPLLGLLLVAGMLLLLSDFGGLARVQRGGGGEAAPEVASASHLAARRAGGGDRPAARRASPAAPARGRAAELAAVEEAEAIAAERAGGLSRAEPAAGGLASGLGAALDAARAAAAAAASRAGVSSGGVSGGEEAQTSDAGPPGETRCNLPASSPDAPLPALDAKLLRAHSNPVAGQARRTVVLAVTDYKPRGGGAPAAQARMALNWVRTVKALRLACLVAVCETANPTRRGVAPLADEDACGLLHYPKRECVVNPRVGRWYLISELTALGYDVFSSDADVALLRNPLPYFGTLMREHPALDVLSTTDANTGVYVHGGGGGAAGHGGVSGGGGKYFHSLVPTAKAHAALLSSPAPPTFWRAAFPQLAALPQSYVFRPEHAWRDVALGAAELVKALESGAYELGLEDPGNCNPHQFNSGVMFWRATPAAAELLARWRVLLDTSAGNPSADDQLPINVVMKNQSSFCATPGTPPGDGGGGSSCGGDRLLNVVAGGAACLGLLNLVQFSNGFSYCTARAHETHGARPFALHATYAGDKVLKLREEGAFYDEAEYYDGGALYLVYEPQVPPEHFHPGLADGAEAPEGYYTWQKHWKLMQAQLQQLRAALAMAKALGRVLVLPRMACSCQCFFYPGRNCVIEGHRVRLPHVCPTDHWLRPGRLQLPHREPGFLDNPRLPAAVRDDVATVAPCEAASAAADAPGCLKPGLGDAALRAALQPHAAKRVLRLEGGSVAPLWGGFAAKADGDAFEAATAGVLGAWCCLKDHPDGLPHPGVEVWKVPYKWEGEPVPVDANNQDLGKCGA